MPTGVTLQVYFNMDEIVELQRQCKERGCEVRQFVKDAVKNALVPKNGGGSSPDEANDGQSRPESRSSEADTGASTKKSAPSTGPPKNSEPYTIRLRSDAKMLKGLVRRSS